MGNKWRKLKYNLIEAKKLGFKSLLTFGGAYSNHIYATAAAGKEFGFATIGIIRGEELHINSNETLKYASESGMQLIFVSRAAYLDKEYLATKYGNNSYILPEGGTNELAIKGVGELMVEIKSQINPDYIAVAVGTGGTMAGLIAGSKPDCKIIGVPVLKGVNELTQLISSNAFEEKSNYLFLHNYHFGGYGKYDNELLGFIQNIENEHNIPLEQVYTGKLFYGIFDKISKGYFPEKSKIVIVHTGGLQGKIIN